MGRKETLRWTLRPMGFHFKNCEGQGSLLIERADCYLQYLERTETGKKRPEVSADEMWIHNHCSVQSDSLPCVFATEAPSGAKQY